jgi:hypothetical protein
MKLMLLTLLGIAEAQRDSIIEKSKAGMAQKIRNGLPQAPRSPYGFHFVTKLELMAEAMQAGLCRQGNLRTGSSALRRVSRR